MPIRIAILASIMTLCAACSPVSCASSGLGASTSDRDFVYGNPKDTRDPLDPSNKGLNPRVVDAQGNAISFPLRVCSKRGRLRIMKYDTPTLSF